jgi:hypothetical protein
VSAQQPVTNITNPQVVGLRLEQEHHAEWIGACVRFDDRACDLLCAQRFGVYRQSAESKEKRLHKPPARTKEAGEQWAVRRAASVIRAAYYGMDVERGYSLGETFAYATRQTPQRL